MLPSDLSALSTFLLVAEERSFTRAAKRSGLSPSAVSHAMRALEEEAGVRLVARTTRSVSLTRLEKSSSVTSARRLRKEEKLWRRSPVGGTRLPAAFVSCFRDSRSPRYSPPNSDNLPASTPRSFSMSPPMIADGTSSPMALMQASTSGNTSRKT